MVNIGNVRGRAVKAFTTDLSHEFEKALRRHAAIDAGDAVEALGCIAAAYIASLAFGGDRAMACDALTRRMNLALQAPALAPATQAHPDDVSVIEFAGVMIEKMKVGRERKARAGWRECSLQDLWRMIREHIEKGDPVDIANFAMMIWHNLRGAAETVYPAGHAPPPSPASPAGSGKRIDLTDVQGALLVFLDAREPTWFCCDELTRFRFLKGITESGIEELVGAGYLFRHWAGDIVTLTEQGSEAAKEFSPGGARYHG